MNWFNKNETFCNVSIDSILVAIRNTLSSVYAYFIDSSSCLVQKISSFNWEVQGTGTQNHQDDHPILGVHQ
jgi:hypothetical protein